MCTSLQALTNITLNLRRLMNPTLVEHTFVLNLIRLKGELVDIIPKSPATRVITTLNPLYHR